MGLIQSRTMASDGRTIRLPLNISESRETTTGRFLTTSSGAGVQHIAMASDDIRHSMEQLAARGARFLPIPGNYYDDIEARWGLEDAQVAVLRAHNILYDRDDNGEFLHAYTDPFDDRFFFEIVQRIGDYQQYGAANASVRMAAQAARAAQPVDRLRGLTKPGNRFIINVQEGLRGNHHDDACLQSDSATPGGAARRRVAVGGATHRACGRADPCRGAAGEDRADRCADGIPRQRHVHGDGGAEEHAHGPAGRTGLAG